MLVTITIEDKADNSFSMAVEFDPPVTDETTYSAALVAAEVAIEAVSNLGTAKGVAVHD